jgi:hypothetical protein
LGGTGRRRKRKKRGAAALGVGGFWGWVDVDRWQPYIARV